MSRKQLFSQLALSTSIAMGVAAVQAQNIDMTTNIALGTMFGQGLASMGKEMTPETSNRPPANVNLEKLIAISGKSPVVESCYSELKVQPKALGITPPAEAQRVLDCADQKNLNRFLDKPSENRAEVAQMVYARSGSIGAARDIKNSSLVAYKVAEECKARDQVISHSFSDCAKNIYQDTVNFYNKIMLGGALFSLAFALGTGVCMAISDRNLKKLAALPDNKPS